MTSFNDRNKNNHKRFKSGTMFKNVYTPKTLSFKIYQTRKVNKKQFFLKFFKGVVKGVIQDDGRTKLAVGAPHDHQHSRQDCRDHEMCGGRDDDEARGGRQRDEVSVGAQAPAGHHHFTDERIGNYMTS